MTPAGQPDATFCLPHKMKVRTQEDRGQKPLFQTDVWMSIPSLSGYLPDSDPDITANRRSVNVPCADSVIRNVSNKSANFPGEKPYFNGTIRWPPGKG